ncbi:MAG: hypothetical protein KBD46_01965 [Candidatus Levybacteria bacterium]|nr:hypothetical protein [Candidatus Levybacteria bacterium]
MKSELLLSSVILLLLLIFLNPLNIFMPPTIVMVLVLILLILFSIFGALVWKEKPHDEREVLLSQKAGRVAFLTGMTVLVIGITYQEYHHTLDPWLIYALVAMILGKVIGYWHAQNNG